MLNWNKTWAALAISAALAVPAFADGVPGQKVNRGPEPVQPDAPAPSPDPMQQTRATPCCGTTTRTVVKQHPPVVTKRTVTHRKPRTSHRTVQASSEVRLDTASFTGGVGAGVSGGFYGGGGVIVLTGRKSFSGVLSHGASAFTFSRRMTGGQSGQSGHAGRGGAK